MEQIIATQLDSLGFREAPVAMMLLSHRRIIRVNLEFESLFGWSQDELDHRSVRLLYSSDVDYEKTGKRCARHFSGEQVYEDERFMRSRDGVVLWVQARGKTMTPEAPFKLTIWTFDLVHERLTALQRLTLREREVARYVVNGFTSKEIGQALGISHRTVEVHRSAIMGKLGVANTAELVDKLR